MTKIKLKRKKIKYCCLFSITHKQDMNIKTPPLWHFIGSRKGGVD